MMTMDEQQRDFVAKTMPEDIVEGAIASAPIDEQQKNFANSEDPRTKRNENYDPKFHGFLLVIFKICKRFGYRLYGKIRVQDIKTGRVIGDKEA